MILKLLCNYENIRGHQIMKLLYYSCTEIQELASHSSDLILLHCVRPNFLCRRVLTVVTGEDADVRLATCPPLRPGV
jgi:hypothetical protein